MEPILSMIVATYQRDICLEELLESLSKQDISRDAFEVIIVDQNKSLDIGPIIRRFENILSLQWIKTTSTGSSIARNMGIKSAKGKYIGFPDDDCIYYSDTVKTIIDSFVDHDIDVIIGRIYDRQKNKKILRYWRNRPMRLTRPNFYWNFACVVLFAKQNGTMFDERLGPGRHYGACEDADWIYTSLKAGQRILYLPDIEVWHPDPDTLDPARMQSYSLGFGGFCRKNLDFPILFLFCFSLGSNLVRAILNFFRNNRTGMINALFSCYWRLKGFRDWPRRPDTTGRLSREG